MTTMQDTLTQRISGVKGFAWLRVFRMGETPCDWQNNQVRIASTLAGMAKVVRSF